MKRSGLVLATLAWVACSDSFKVSGVIEIEGAETSEGVAVMSLGTGQSSTVSDRLGRFELHVPQRDVSLFVTASHVKPEGMFVNAHVGESVHVKLRAMGRILGRVIRKENGANGTQGIIVSAAGGESNAVTDENGFFEISVPTGIQTVEAVAQGYSVASARVQVMRGQSADAGTLEVERIPDGWSGILAGRVERISGESPDGLSVRVAGLHRSTQTRDGGYFEISDIPEGQYQLVVEHGTFVETVPQVLATRGSDGFIVEGGLFRLAEHVIPLADSDRIQSCAVSGMTTSGSSFAWICYEPSQSTLHWSSIDGGVQGSVSLGSYTYPRWEGALLYSADAGEIIVGQRSYTAISTQDGGSHRWLDNALQLLGASWTAPGLSSASQVMYVTSKVGSGNLELKIAHFDDGLGAPTSLGDAEAWGTPIFAGKSAFVLNPHWSTPSILWWKDGAAQTLNGAYSRDRAITVSSENRWVKLEHSSGTTIVDSRSGDEVFTVRSWGDSVFSDDGQQMAYFGDPNGYFGVYRRTLPGGDVHYLKSPGGVIRCMSNGSVVFEEWNGQSSGDIYSTSDAGVVKLWANDGGTANRTIGCWAGFAYYYESATETEPGRMVELRISGGQARELAKDRSTRYFVRESVARNGSLWFSTDGHYEYSSSIGHSVAKLWVTSFGSGSARLVVNDVVLDYRNWLEFSPDGRHVAFRTVDGLYVASTDGTGLRRIARRAESIFWLNNQELVFNVGQPEAPLGFQGGVYRSRVSP